MRPNVEGTAMHGDEVVDCYVEQDAEKWTKIPDKVYFLGVPAFQQYSEH